MRQTRTTALSRHRAPSFALVAGLELLQLRKLPSFARAVFLELVALAAPDGSVWTSYAQLAALLDFDQAPGAHTEPRPTQRRLRTALEALADVDLIRLDRRRNRSAKALFFQLSPRQGIASPANRSDTRSDRRSDKGFKREKHPLVPHCPQRRRPRRSSSCDSCKNAWRSEPRRHIKCAPQGARNERALTRAHAPRPSRSLRSSSCSANATAANTS